MTDHEIAPYFSIVLPAHETPAHLLREAIGSVQEQTFDDWELVIVDDGSTSAEVPAVLEEASADRRIVVFRRATNGGIGVATRDGLARARGCFVGFLDHDDLLDPRALEVCAEALQENPGCDFLYTDEDRVDLEGHQLEPVLKPDWSPERLRAQNYVNHLSVYRRSLVDQVGGMREGFDGSQDYDLVLRATEQARKIIHIREILYHWRLRPGQVSTAGNPSVFDAARRAISEHCHRVGIDGTVEQIHPLGVYRIHRVVKGEPLVSIVIPTKGSIGTVWGHDRAFVVAAVESIVQKSTYQELEIVVVADRDTPESVIQQLTAIGGDCLRVLWYDLPFNFAHKTNLGVASASGEYVLLLNDDVEVINADWVETMLGLAQEPDVGLVGAMLFYEDGTIQHAGHEYSWGHLAHIGYGCEASTPGPSWGLQLERECSGVTAACAMLTRDDYMQAGGLSRSLPFNFNDVDLSLKLRSLGRRIVWTPFARLHHFESRTRVAEVSRSETERVMLRWGRILQQADPYWR